MTARPQLTTDKERFCIFPPLRKGGWGDFFRNEAMRPYKHTLKNHARHLRTNMTDSEHRLWTRLRRKQLLGVQVYRQKPIGSYIVDFYAPRVGLVIEVDGAQHLEGEHAKQDAQRDAYLRQQGLRVLRFNNIEVLRQTDEVVEVIFRVMEERMGGETARRNPPCPPFVKGCQMDTNFDLEAFGGML